VERSVDTKIIILCTNQQIEQYIRNVLHDNYGCANAGFVVEKIYEKYGGKRLQQKQIFPSIKIKDLEEQGVIGRNGKYIYLSLRELATYVQSVTKNSY
jgi:hypothetical protein